MPYPELEGHWFIYLHKMVKELRNSQRDSPAPETKRELNGLTLLMNPQQNP